MNFVFNHLGFGHFLLKNVLNFIKLFILHFKQAVGYIDGGNYWFNFPSNTALMFRHIHHLFKLVKNRFYKFVLWWCNLFSWLTLLLCFCICHSVIINNQSFEICNQFFLFFFILIGFKWYWSIGKDICCIWDSNAFSVGWYNISSWLCRIPICSSSSFAFFIPNGKWWCFRFVDKDVYIWS